MKVSWINATAFFVLGTIVGSFFNVVIHRLPQGESIINPRSYCPKCRNRLKWYHNIPIISYIALRGRCAFCSEPMSPRYLIVELLTGIATAAIYLHFGLSPQLIWALVLLLPLIPAAFIDLKHYILPDSITIGCTLWGIASAALSISPTPIKDAFLGLLVCGGIFFLIAVLSKGGMGLGDVKLAAAIGANFGWKIGVTSLFLSVLLGAVTGIVLMLLRKKGRKDKIPFGPFMIVSIYICAFFGRELARWYLGSW